MEIDNYGNVIIEYFPMRPEKSLAIFLQSAESAEKGAVADKVWRRVGQDIVSKAQAYLVNNGSFDTGNLYNSIQANINNGQLELTADAKNRYGNAYGGSVEYGFIHHYSKSFVPAKPFMRPAIEDSISLIQRQFGNEVMSSYLSGIGLAGMGGILMPGGSFSSGFKSFGMKGGQVRLAGSQGGWTRGFKHAGQQATTFKMAQRQTARTSTTIKRSTYGGNSASGLGRGISPNSNYWGGGW